MCIRERASILKLREKRQARKPQRRKQQLRRILTLLKFQIRNRRLRRLLKPLRKKLKLKRLTPKRLLKSMLR